MSSELPSGWVRTTIGEINVYSSSNIDPLKEPDQVFELYSVPIYSTGRPEYQLGQDIGSTKQAVEPDDVLLCKINPRINRVWIVGPKSESPQIGSSEWVVIRQPLIHAGFLRYQLSGHSFREKLCSEVSGVGGSLTRAQPKKVATYSVVLPPLAEQTRIAQKLDELLAQVDTLKARIDAIPALLKRFRQSVLAAAVSGRLTENWRKGEPANWTALTIADLIDGKPRNGYSPKAVEYDTGVKSLSLSATTSGIFKGEYFKYVDQEISKESYLWLQPGDILIQRANTLEYVGVSAIYEGDPLEYIYPDLMMKCRAKDRVLTKFLYFCLSSQKVRKHFRDHATGTAGNMPKINQHTVMNAPALLPPLAEQTEIVRRVEQLFAFADQLEAKVATAQARIDRLTQSILAKAFRGELVPQDPNDEPASVLLERIQAQRAAAPKATA